VHGASFPRHGEGIRRLLTTTRSPSPTPGWVAWLPLTFYPHASASRELVIRLMCFPRLRAHGSTNHLIPDTDTEKKKAGFLSTSRAAARQSERQAKPTPWRGSTDARGSGSVAAGWNAQGTGRPVPSRRPRGHDRRGGGVMRRCRRGSQRRRREKRCEPRVPRRKKQKEPGSTSPGRVSSRNRWRP
jgi:hypothetical protein